MAVGCTFRVYRTCSDLHEWKRVKDKKEGKGRAKRREEARKGRGGERRGREVGRGGQWGSGAAGIWMSATYAWCFHRK